MPYQTIACKAPIAYMQEYKLLYVIKKLLIGDWKMRLGKMKIEREQSRNPTFAKNWAIRNKAFAEGYDLIVVGSDTILVNLERNGHYGLMWLRGIDTQKILFAASAAPANFALNDQQRNDLRQSFSTFTLLGVRDRVTEHLLRDEIGMGDKVYTQYDPTYLIPESEFSLPYLTRKKLEGIRKRQKIALVNFAVTGCPFKREMTAFLKRQGYYTISTLYNQWADCNLMSLSPFGWAAMFRYVDLTVTERFHDSVFTLRNGKPVVAIDWSRNRFSKDGFSKTRNLLSLYGLERNHFIATGLEEAKSAMGYIKTIDVEKQREVIKKHNLTIVGEYTNVMNNIYDQLKHSVLGDNHSGGGKSA